MSNNFKPDQVPDLGKVIDAEHERNAQGRPDPFQYVEKEATEALLADSQTLSTKLTQNFDKWDTNHDGLLAPLEVENVFTNDSLSTEERTAAAAVRLAYKQFAHMEMPLEGGDSSFITQSDINSLEILFDQDKNDKAFEKWWDVQEKAAYDKMGDMGWFFTGLMGAAGIYDYYVSAPAKWDELREEKLARLTDLPQKVQEKKDLPPCTGTSKDGEKGCSIY